MKKKEDLIKQYQHQQKNKNLIESYKKFNKLKEEIYTRWGKKRFINLLSQELRTRFKRAETKYNYEIGNTKNKIILNNMMIRAYQAVKEELMLYNYEELNDNYIYFTNHEAKQNYVIVVDNDKINNAFNKFKNENVIILSLSEIILLIDSNFNKLKRDTHKLSGRIIKYNKIDNKEI